MTPPGDRGSLSARDEVGRLLRGELGGRLRNRLADGRRDRLADGLRNRLADGLRDRLADGLRDRLGGRLGGGLPARPQRHARITLGIEPRAQDLVQLDLVALEAEP